MFPETRPAWCVPGWAEHVQTCAPTSCPPGPLGGPSACSSSPPLPHPVVQSVYFRLFLSNNGKITKTREPFDRDRVRIYTASPTCGSVVCTMIWPSAACTSVLMGRVSTLDAWPGSESGSCTKKSSSPLLRLHRWSSSGRTSGSGSGGGLNASSTFLISVSVSSCFTVERPKGQLCGLCNRRRGHQRVSQCHPLIVNVSWVVTVVRRFSFTLLRMCCCNSNPALHTDIFEAIVKLNTRLQFWWCRSDGTFRGRNWNLIVIELGTRGDSGSWFGNVLCKKASSLLFLTKW